MIIKRGRYVRFIYKAFEYVYECMSAFEKICWRFL